MAFCETATRRGEFELLPKPGGFEGLLGAGEEANPKQLSVFDLNDCPNFLVELDGACATPKMKLAKRDNVAKLRDWENRRQQEIPCPYSSNGLTMRM
jgi:hypothetical protein